MQSITRKNITLFLIIIASMVLLTACIDISPTEGILRVHFIDVGQADCILIQEGEYAMLIDGGNNVDGERIVDYIKKQGIQNINTVIATHPHADHIGGLDTVINSFEIGDIWMPKVTHNTRTFTDLLKAIKNKNLKINFPNPGDIIHLQDAEAVIVAPNSEIYEGFNNYSIVLKLNYKNTSFIFTGDAESLSEEEMLEKSFDLDADVLKVGHHGSNTSTTPTFLDAVNPKYAVIQCGLDNSYGHPHKEVLQRLNENMIEIYRTDQNGTIVAISDGDIIEFESEK